MLILGCSIPLACASFAKLIAVVKFGSVSNNSLIPAPFLFFVRSQNLRNDVIPCASKIFNAYVILIAVNNGFAERRF